MTPQQHWIWQHTEWPRFTWDDTQLASLLREINQLQGKLLGQTEGMDLQQPELDALLQNAINTSAIEGEELNVESVRSSLAKQLGIDQAGLPPGTPQSDGLAELLIDATHHFDVPLTKDRLYQWHRALFPLGQSGLTPIRVGEIRGPEPMQVISGPVGKRVVHFEAPPNDNLGKELDEFLAWFSQNHHQFDPILRAGVAHLWFITLHPFEDGNGRMARAISDLVLAQSEHRNIRFYAMAASVMQNRQAYYQILEQTQRNALDITPWLLWFSSMFKQTILDAVERVRYVLLKAKFWQRHAQTTLSERQIKVLNRLLDAGPGDFEGGLNTRKYVGLTKASKATATRDLLDLVEKGCLIKREAGGRSTSYDVNWP